MDRFHLLKTGLALVQLFVGTKMNIVGWYKIPIGAPLAVVGALIGGAIMASRLVTSDQTRRRFASLMGFLRFMLSGARMFLVLAWLFVGTVLMLADWERAMPIIISVSIVTAVFCVATAAALLLCLSVCWGPLHRICGGLPRAVRLRRPLGIVGAVAVVGHVAVSLLLLANHARPTISKEPLVAYLLTNWLSTVCGTLATLGLLALWAASYDRCFRWLGQDRWKALHAMVWVILVLTLLHFACIGMNANTNPWGKLSNWVKWFKEFTPALPPGTLIPFVAGTVVILLKAIDVLVSARRAKAGQPCAQLDGSPPDCGA